MTDLLDRLKAALADRYTIEREIGRGGMATVYLAEEPRHDRQLAIKVLRPELAATLGPARFLREIKTTASLSHPHILPLFDSGEADGFLFYVMPFVEGESLRTLLNREKQLPVDDALQITRDVADALGFAHSRNVVHRDIKPGNILLEAGHAVVADFGIAQAITDAGGDRLTDTGLLVGTPEYMSPEQAAGSQDLDERSDTYSLACVLYEMLAGDPPFAGSIAQAILARKSVEVAPRLRHVRETVPPSVEQAVSRALARVPADRFRTVQQFAEALTATAASPRVVPPMDMPLHEELDVFGLTHPGKVQKVNQDHFLMCTLSRDMRIQHTSLPNGNRLPLKGERLAYLAMVADGTGRESRGADASRLAIEVISQYLVQRIRSYRFAGTPEEEAFIDGLRDAVMQCHARVLQRATEEEPGGRGMATTLTAWIGIWPRSYLLQVGDSRCYAYHDGMLRQISRDQPVTQRLVDDEWTPESNGERVLSSAIGGVQITPVITGIRQAWGAVGLICSHGLTKHVPDEQIRKRLGTMTSARQVCEDLLQDALDGGGSDNITVIVGRAVATDAD